MKKSRVKTTGKKQRKRTSEENIYNEKAKKPMLDEETLKRFEELLKKFPPKF